MELARFYFNLCYNELRYCRWMGNALGINRMGGYSTMFRNVGTRNIWDVDYSMKVCLST